MRVVGSNSKIAGDSVVDADRLYQNTSLSERESEVTALRVEGKSFHEIADELEISPQNANRCWQRAKKKAADAKESVSVFKDVGLVG